MVDVEKIKKDRICPVCGQRITYLEKKKIHERIYFYSVHVKREGGKRKVKRCYLGPETRLKPPSVSAVGPQTVGEISPSLVDVVRISSDEFRMVMLYYDKRRTGELTNDEKGKAREIFRKVFRPGRRIVEIETP
jgi:hypothetical protein